MMVSRRQVIKGAASKDKEIEAAGGTVPLPTGDQSRVTKEAGSSM